LASTVLFTVELPVNLHLSSMLGNVLNLGLKIILGGVILNL